MAFAYVWVSVLLGALPAMVYADEIRNTTTDQILTYSSLHRYKNTAQCRYIHTQYSNSYICTPSIVIQSVKIVTKEKIMNVVERSLPKSLCAHTDAWQCVCSTEQEKKKTNEMQRKILPLISFCLFSYTNLFR